MRKQEENKEDKTFISVNMTWALRQRLDRLAGLYGKSRASTCRQILENHVRWYERKKGEIK